MARWSLTVALPPRHLPLRPLKPPDRAAAPSNGRGRSDREDRTRLCPGRTSDRTGYQQPVPALVVTGVLHTDLYVCLQVFERRTVLQEIG